MNRFALSLVDDTVSGIKLSHGNVLLQFVSAALEQDCDFSWHASIPDLESLDSESVSIDCDDAGQLYSSWAASFNEHFDLPTA